MTTTKLVTTVLTTIAAAATLLVSADADACGTPDRLLIDSIQFPSWSPDVGGTWTALASSGNQYSQGKCYKQDPGVNAEDQVMFVYDDLWYVAIAPDCDNLGMGTPIAAFYGAPASQPEQPDFVHALRTLRIEIAADDAYDVQVDGVQQDILFNGSYVSSVTGGGYFSVGVVELDVLGEGDVSTVEIHAADTALNVASMAAAIMVDGGSCGTYKTGSNAFAYGNVVDKNGVSQPGISGAQAPVVTTPVPMPANLASLGAQWVWWSSDATALGSADFSIDITAP
jgi:hypothetical protein